MDWFSLFFVKKYPNTERANWRNITDADATSDELHLVHMISGERPKHITPEQWRLNMRVCAREIRHHVEQREDTGRISWLEKYCAYVKFESEDEGSFPAAKVYIPDLEDGWKCIGEGDDYREAIDAAMASVSQGLNADDDQRRSP